MRIHWIQVEAFSKWDQQQIETGACLDTWTTLSDNSWGRWAVKDKRSPDFRVLALSLSCPDSPGRYIFFMSFLRMSWQNLNDFVFYFWKQVFSWWHDLIVHQNVTRKKKTIHKAISSFYFRVWSAARMHEGKFVGMAII